METKPLIKNTLGPEGARITEVFETTLKAQQNITIFKVHRNSFMFTVDLPSHTPPFGSWQANLVLLDCHSPSVVCVL